MDNCQTRQEYQWISGACRGILESTNLRKFYYNEECVKFGKCIELDVKEIHKRIYKDETIYNPRFACGAVCITGLGVGIYNIWIKLPTGKHINPEIRLVNMFDENKNAFYVLKGYTGKRNGYKRFMRKYCNVFSYARSNKNISNVYVHERKDYPNGINGGLQYIKLIITSDCIIMKMCRKTVFVASKVEAKDTIESFDRIASLAIAFSLNVDPDYKKGDLKNKFKIVSFDFVPLHKINDTIDK